ncbi:hypothetical protein BC833DRAFT_647280 [Globomyces pollinis-pini]|nr:hypothetical protein BC833DRAFT_647280 [Globomyces pollinis-pini]
MSNSREGLTHSMIERRRRIQIKSCVEQLKELVPNSAHQKSIQKLHILENAVAYIKELEERLKGANSCTCNCTYCNCCNYQNEPSRSGYQIYQTFNPSAGPVSHKSRSPSPNPMSLANILEQ